VPGGLDYRAETFGTPAATPRRRPPTQNPAGPNRPDRRTPDRRTDHAQWLASVRGRCASIRRSARIIWF